MRLDLFLATCLICRIVDEYASLAVDMHCWACGWTERTKLNYHLLPKLGLILAQSCLCCGVLLCQTDHYTYFLSYMN